MYLQDKKILFIAPSFYSYHLSLIETMKNEGATVDFYRERPDTLLWRFSKKLSKKLQNILEVKYLQKILDSVDEKEYDYFFLIRGEIVTTTFLRDLKEKLPTTKFIMYQWDSDRVVDYVQNIKYFDRVLTFDMVDAKKHSIQYFPLFYTKEFEKPINVEKKYDIVFVGYYHTDRLDVVKMTIDECKNLNLNFKYYIQLKFLVMLKFLVQGKLYFSDLKYIKLAPLSLESITKLYSESKAVLDIENYNQNGLTMRSIEVLGSKIKLITTNYSIKNEIFYTNTNISIINRKSVSLDKKFFIRPFNANYNIENQSIKNWLKYVFEE